MRIAVAGGTGAVGRRIVELADAAGHEVRVLSRSTGVDLERGTGLDLTGVDTVIDASGVQTTSARRSERFFTSATRHLLAAEVAAGVTHHVALSIVGASRAPHGYYAGKAAQERAVAAGPVPWSILRAAQFFEFAHQVATRVGPLVVVPAMRSQPLAATTVAARLLELAEGGPIGDAEDLAGPREERMVELTRAWRARTGATGRVIEVPIPGGFGRAIRSGAILPGPGAQLTTQTFAEWLQAEPPLR
ncbi:NmrA family NAD(P)-binding protein [Leucobacter rhizosphaerae]|uniref:NmrA family NAD(P)-binding protein n=1 Tax=Leucobacter rhizosphaerae TaxID=2932245 RepID=A0ABY4FW88_9MICO|nr:NmrA family NAD(P)-binding protein [Leucobacter rhizosphaerae]UOQ60547.1 NmrA family NAD(P)-binding protein [Leucobacter rhizosphaerae]